MIILECAYLGHLCILYMLIYYSLFVENLLIPEQKSWLNDLNNPKMFN